MSEHGEYHLYLDSDIEKMHARIEELEAECELGRKTLKTLDESLAAERAHKASYIAENARLRAALDRPIDGWKKLRAAEARIEELGTEVEDTRRTMGDMQARIEELEVYEAVARGIPLGHTWEKAEHDEALRQLQAAEEENDRLREALSHSSKALEESQRTVNRTEAFLAERDAENARLRDIIEALGADPETGRFRAALEESE